MQRFAHLEETANSKVAIILLFVIFFIYPLAGIVGTTFVILRHKSQRWLLPTLFIMLAVYMGIINATKIPESDQVQYMNAYRLVPYQTIWESLTNIYGRTDGVGTTKEMGYGLLNLVGYYLSFGYYPLFILLFTVVLYLIYFKSIYKLYSFCNITDKIPHVIAACFILCFFSQFFNLTIHLQRQVIATAVMIYCIVSYCEQGKPNWILILIATSLHTSVVLFVPLFFIRYFFKNLGLKQILLIIIVMVTLIASLFVLALKLLPLIGLYGIERLAKAGLSQEKAFETSFMLFFSAPLLFIALKNILRDRKHPNHGENLFYLFYIYVLLFSLLTPDATMKYRYFMMSYAFWPIILPLLFKRPTIIAKSYLFLVSTFFFFRFFITFNDMTWKYAPMEIISTTNALSIFLYMN